MAPDDSTESNAKAQQAKLAADMETVLKEGLNRATTSMKTYTDYAIKASKRVIEGDTKTDDWAKDAAEISAQWIKDVTGAMTGWAQAVNILAGRDKGGKDAQQQSKGGG